MPDVCRGHADAAQQRLHRSTRPSDQLLRWRTQDDRLRQLQGRRVIAFRQLARPRKRAVGSRTRVGGLFRHRFRASLRCTVVGWRSVSRDQCGRHRGRPFAHPASDAALRRRHSSDRLVPLRCGSILTA